MSSDWQRGTSSLFGKLATLLETQARLDRVKYARKLQEAEAFLERAGRGTEELRQARAALGREILQRKSYDLTVPPVPPADGLRHLRVRETGRFR